MQQLRHSLIIFCIVVVSSSCDDDLDVVRELRPGIIELFGEPIVIDAPDTVMVDTPFVILIRTYGSGCIETGITRVTESETRIILEPMDWFVRNLGCTDILTIHKHEQVLSFNERGTIRLIIRGKRRVSRDGMIIEEPFQFEQIITVE